MNKKPVETIMGFVVLAVAVFFLLFAYRVSDLQVVKGYELNAKFLKVGGLNIGSDVRINGIKVGTVVNQKLDNNDYMVDVILSIASGDGLVGDKFIKIEPGRSDEFLKDGETFANTKDFKTLEEMVGEIIFMVTDDGSEN